MKLLAIDSATEACSAALLHEGGLIERYELIGRGHAERLLPMVDELLAEAGIGLAALDAIAFGRGPGGFTGLRIAAGITQGLAAGARLPVLPVSDLAAVAAAGARQSGASRVLVCMDARMGQVYWAAFDCSAVPAARPDAGGGRRSGASDAAGRRCVVRRRPWICGLSGNSRHASVRGSTGTAPELLPRASDIARIAAADFAAGHGLPAARALPVYLRNDVVHRR